MSVIEEIKGDEMFNTFLYKKEVLQSYTSGTFESVEVTNYYYYLKDTMKDIIRNCVVAAPAAL